MIKAFSICACNKAKDRNFTGHAIAQLMESHWNRWCPGIELSCDPSTYAPYLRRRRRKRHIIFRIKRAISALDDEEKARIARAVCRYLRREYDEAEVEISAVAASDDNTRRRLVDAADPDTESDVTVDVTGDQGFDDAIADAACSSAGLTEALGDIAGGSAISISCDSGQFMCNFVCIQLCI